MLTKHKNYSTYIIDSCRNHQQVFNYLYYHRVPKKKRRAIRHQQRVEQKAYEISASELTAMEKRKNNLQNKTNLRQLVPGVSSYTTTKKSTKAKKDRVRYVTEVEKLKLELQIARQSRNDLGLNGVDRGALK